MPRSKPHTLLVTVGTSLTDNLDSLPNSPGEFYNSAAARGAESVEWSTIERIAEYFRGSHWTQLGKTLSLVPNAARLSGAEINSIADLERKGLVDLSRIVFLVSDTPQGKQAGSILKAYYDTQAERLRLHRTECRPIEGLQDSRPADFRTHGLRNLVREVGKILLEVGDSSYVAINATGGYKAQIAVAVIMGIALDIEVYYKHQRFSEIISFPPLPVIPDYELLGRHARLISAVENRGMIAEEDIGVVDEELHVLLDQETIDGKGQYALSPVGEIYLTGFRVRYPSRPSELRDAFPDERRPPTGPDDHYPKGFKEYVAGVWRETPWITRCVYKDYAKQAGIRQTGFDVKDRGVGEKQRFTIVGTYLDKDAFGGRFEVMVTSDRLVDLTWAVDRLNRAYGRWVFG